MPCQNSTCSNIYHNSGTSIYVKKCDISNSQQLFMKNLPAFHQLDISTRKDNGIPGCVNRCKGEKRLRKQLSHAEIINIQKARSYYDPKSFRRLKH